MLQPRVGGRRGSCFKRRPIYMYLGRATSAFLGAFSVVALYALGLRLAGPAVGMLAALFLALNFLHVRDSHFATNDVAGGGACARLLGSVRERSSIRPSALFVWAGLVGGLATSAKYSMGLYLLPLGLAWLLLERRARGASDGGTSSLIAAGVASVVGFLAGTPYTLLTWDKFRTDFFVQMRLGGEGWEGQSSASVPQLYLDTLMTGIGWPLVVLAAIGALLALKRDWRLALVLLAFPVGYGLFMARQQLFFARFALPLAPFFALFGAYAMVKLRRCSGNPRIRRRREPALALVIALSPSTLSIAAHNVLISRPDTRIEAFEWMRATLPANIQDGH